MFDTIKIYKSGRELKNAIIARINLSDVSDEKKLPINTKTILQMMERNLVDNYRYELSIEEALLLNI